MTIRSGALHVGKQSTRPSPRVAFPRTAPAPRKATYDYSCDVGDALGCDLVVTAQISAGPHTEIYRVWSESRKCDFACKILRHELAAGGKHGKLLEREALVLRRVQHPNVIRLFDPARGLDRPHVVMVYIAGPSLLDRLGAAPKRRLKVDEALRIAIRLGSALEAVHAAGYLYRDLKPANVLMRGDEPVLIDLGAVYQWKPGRRARERVGTDPYMAPEQCLGEPLSPQTDVYGLGAVAYEMITGEWPHEDRLMNVFDRSRLHTRFPQVAFEPGSVRRKVQSASMELDAVIRRCLDRDPRRRYRSVAEAIVALDALLEIEDRVLPSNLDTDRAA